MSKTLSTKYYLEHKERLQKKTREGYENFSKEEKEKKSNNMLVNVTKIYQNMKNKSFLSIEKNIVE